MQFEQSYWHALDPQAQKVMKISPKYIGISTPPMESQLNALKTRIFQGAGVVELGFTGKGKGSLKGGNTTPEMFGKDEREAMRQLSRINEVPLSVHASVSVGDMSGRTERGFDPQLQQQNVNEIKRAIDFAADTAEGGPVVVHTGEFPRSIHEKFGKEGFRAYPEEEKKAQIFLADEKTGQIIAIGKDQEFFEPVPDKRDPKTGEPVSFKLNEDGTIELRKRTYDDIIDEEKKKAKMHGEKFIPEKAFIEHYYRAKRDEAHAMALRWAGDAKAHIAQADEIKKEYLKAKELEKGLTEAQKKAEAERLIRAAKGRFSDASSPSEFYKKQFEDNERNIRFMQEYSLSASKNVKEIDESISRMKPIEDVGLSRASRGVARAAMHAFEVTKSKKLKKPLFVAPENLFPEQGFGSHPDELKKIISKSREAMSDMLVENRHMSRSQADKIAADHIKATFDVGHAFTWKKFFKGKPEEFEKWLMKKVDELNKEGIIGHVHVSDNFGYYDEHLTPGEGDVPIGDFLKNMRKAGYEGPVIVEPAHQDVQAMLGAWRALQSPIYRIDGATETWTDMQWAHAGHTYSPGYVVGDYAPNPETWTLWSGVPLE